MYHCEFLVHSMDWQVGKELAGLRSGSEDFNSFVVKLVIEGNGSQLDLQIRLMREAQTNQLCTNQCMIKWMMLTSTTRQATWSTLGPAASSLTRVIAASCSFALNNAIAWNPSWSLKRGGCKTNITCLDQEKEKGGLRVSVCEREREVKGCPGVVDILFAAESHTFGDISYQRRLYAEGLCRDDS